MVIWAAVVGALLGWFGAGFEGWGAVLGAGPGALAGLGLRGAVRAEIERALARLPAVTPLPVAATPAVEPEESRPRPVVQPPRPAPSPAAVPTEPDEWEREFLPGGRDAAAEPAEPGAVAVALTAARDWLFGGNTVVRLGLVILFLGLSFLARYAAGAGLFPVELRLAAVAGVGVGLLALGFRTARSRPGFGLALQGAGVGAIYLSLFAAVKLVPGFPVGAAFALMIVVCAGGCALALLQGSQALAVTAFAGGFATPLLLSDGSGEPAGLFAYYTILNLAVLFIAFRRAWRALSLLGFLATFGVATMWMAGGYGPADFAVTQAFVAASVPIYLAAAVLLARRSPGRTGALVDTGLLFGPALAGFGLEVALVGDRPFGSAFAAIGFAGLYLGAAAAATRGEPERFRVLREAMLAIGVGFVTLAVPLALGARWTSAAWALEGAGAFWVGMRQARWFPRAAGLALQGVAALVFLSGAGANVAPLPLANASFLGAMLIAGALLATAWWLRRPVEVEGGLRLVARYAALEAGLGRPAFLLGFAFQWLAWTMEAGRVLPPATTEGTAISALAPAATLLLPMLAYALSAWGFRALGRRTGWSVATWPSFATIVAVALTFAAALDRGRHLLHFPDWIAWTIAIGVHLHLLQLNDRDDGDGRARPLLTATHVAGVWLATAMFADCLWLGVDRARLWDTSWAGVVFLASLVAVLVALTLWAGRALGVGGGRWPLDRHADAYGRIAAAPIAALAGAGALATALVASGEMRPLPYLPILNPVDLSVALAIAAVALWRATLLRAGGGWTDALRGPGFAAALGLLAFVGVNAAWFRVAHRWLGVGWNPDALLHDATVQTGLAILWTLGALGLMVAAHRRARRPMWLVGAGLLGLTIAKLLLVDLGGSGGGARIVAFIGVGALMLVLGWLAPLPPKEEGER